jgi:DNA-directed RNA polymerase subunit RPC12/RpoP
MTTTAYRRTWKHQQRCAKCGRFFASDCDYDDYCRTCSYDVAAEQRHREEQQRRFRALVYGSWRQE